MAEREERMPPALRLGVLATVGIAVVGSLYLLSVRGPALLIDISHLAGQMLCF